MPQRPLPVKFNEVVATDAARNRKTRPMPHQFIVLDDAIMTLDNAQEIDDAIDALEELGIQSTEVYAGGPDDERSTDFVLTSGRHRAGEQSR